MRTQLQYKHTEHHAHVSHRHNILLNITHNTQKMCTSQTHTYPQRMHTHITTTNTSHVRASSMHSTSKGASHTYDTHNKLHTHGIGVGTVVGNTVGFGVGIAVGFGVGNSVGFGVGISVGFGVGISVGFGVGISVGFGVGTTDTFGVGMLVGFGVGISVGFGVGISVGFGVGISVGFGVVCYVRCVCLLSAKYVCSECLCVMCERDEIGVC